MAAIAAARSRRSATLEGWLAPLDQRRDAFLHVGAAGYAGQRQRRVIELGGVGTLQRNYLQRG